jgi:hypothetical protein
MKSKNCSYIDFSDLFFNKQNLRSFFIETIENEVTWGDADMTLITLVEVIDTLNSEKSEMDAEMRREFDVLKQEISALPTDTLYLNLEN